jgi:hypothetical protein
VNGKFIDLVKNSFPETRLSLQSFHSHLSIHGTHITKTFIFAWDASMVREDKIKTLTCNPNT